MKRRSLGLLLALVLGLGGGRVGGQEPPVAPASTVAVSEGDALWFPVGEELVYKVYWGWIPVGRTRIVTRWVEEDGRRLIAIRYRTRSNKFLDRIYRVDDVIESLIDPETFLPVQFTKNLKEGRNRYHEVTRFDHAELKAYWRSLRRNKEAVHTIRADTRDLVSFMYYMRSQAFEVGQTLRHEVMADEKIYEMFLKVLRHERIELDAFGTVAAVRVEPEAKFDGLFVRKGRMTLWVSRGERVLCLQVEARVPVANVRAVLVEVHGPGEDFWTRATRRGADKRERDEPEVERAMRELDGESLGL